MIPGNLLHFTAPPGRAKAPRPAQAAKPAPRRAAEPVASAAELRQMAGGRKRDAAKVAAWLRAAKPKKATKPAAERPTRAGLERALAAENARQAKPIGFAAVKGGAQ